MAWVSTDCLNLMLMYTSSLSFYDSHVIVSSTQQYNVIILVTIFYITSTITILQHIHVKPHNLIEVNWIFYLQQPYTRAFSVCKSYIPSQTNCIPSLNNFMLVYLSPLIIKDFNISANTNIPPSNLVPHTLS